MVGINRLADDSDSIRLAEPIDSVGKLEIVTSRTGALIRFNTGTATLVSPNKILTAAHVIDSDRDGQIDVSDLSQYSFLLGDNLAEGAEQSLGISQVSLHPSWIASEANRVADVNTGEGYNSRYDLAVLTLDSNVTNVLPISVSPNVLAGTDNTSLLGTTATLVGYGKFGSPFASMNGDGLRRAAENVIDSVANGLIRFDYDSTYEFEQEVDTGINHPNLDGSFPALIPVANSSPIPLPLEGGIGQGDSGGPLLVESDLGVPTIVGVASQFIDTEAIGIPLSSYGSVYVYSALNDPATLEFLAAENVINLEPTVAAAATTDSYVEVVNSSLDVKNISGTLSNSGLLAIDSAAVEQADISTALNESNFIPNDNNLEI
ncbi:trypsin-like serine protease [Pleurocapsales cyanobacterium LEGE 10410]|nr:trypsin-like serine protease [Pleurocapsales cyanobacterium LEGE 10410]